MAGCANCKMHRGGYDSRSGGAGIMEHLVLKRADGPDLAYRYRPGAGPCVVFLGGYRSDMAGTKAAYLEDACAARWQGYVRFDYRGHGLSGGDFAAGTIGLWTADALAVCDAVAPSGPVLLVGSSMGGWIALLAARALGTRVAGIVGIAAAPDFTRPLYDSLDEAQRAALARDGFIAMPNDYSTEPYIFTAALFADGDAQCILPSMPHYACPIRLVQGMKDTDVPWQTAHRIKNAAPGADITVTLVADGDHRLSRPEDLALIDAQITAICACI